MSSTSILASNTHALPKLRAPRTEHAVMAIARLLLAIVLANVTAVTANKYGT
jgi:hypothetical protein